MRIESDTLDRPEVLALLAEHLGDMHHLSPPDAVFALDVDKLRAPDIAFWTAWDGDALLGCGALRELSPAAGEIKSMRTPQASRGRGAGKAILQHILAVARQRGYATLYLETGSHPDFAPAWALYRSAGFVPCGPYGDYRDNGFSVFMALALQAPEAAHGQR
jgi:putative acetyltransferase